MVEHVKRKHGVVTKEGVLLKCRKCDFSHISESTVKAHFTKRHFEGAQFECVECEAKFNSKRGLQKHSLRTHPAAPTHTAGGVYIAPVQPLGAGVCLDPAPPPVASGDHLAPSSPHHAAGDLLSPEPDNVAGVHQNPAQLHSGCVHLAPSTPHSGGVQLSPGIPHSGGVHLAPGIPHSGDVQLAPATSPIVEFSGQGQGWDQETMIELSDRDLLFSLPSIIIDSGSSYQPL